MIVGVKFCGNCNPHIATPVLLKKLQHEAPDIEFTFNDDIPWDAVLVLNACPVGCRNIEGFKDPVVVTSETVDYWPVEKKDMVKTILNALRTR